MSNPTPLRQALGQSLGLTAFVWGYPLVESLRTCRLQTSSEHADQASWFAEIDRLQHVERVTNDGDRDVVTPANDLLYTTAWIHLANGPRLLHVPAAAAHGGRYFVLALYDAWTNNFENLGLRNCAAQGESVWLVGPDQPADAMPKDGRRVVKSPTPLVWLLARVVAGEGNDVLAARALQKEIRLEVPKGTDAGVRPTAVERWSGPVEDTMAAHQARPDELATWGAHFFNNLCRGLASQPVQTQDQGLAAWLSSHGLSAHDSFNFEQLPPDLQSGLLQGLRDGARLLLEGSRSRKARPWAAHFGLGRYGCAHLVRALTAYKGLGALAPEEAIYAMGDFDGDQTPLNGERTYHMHFAPGELPPVDAFWSVTLYDADRFLYGNAIQRHAIGDRTPGLVHDAQGGLTLTIAHQPPADTRNWLPAPAGQFYLVLRMYLPRPEARTWTIPVLQEVHA